MRRAEPVAGLGGVALLVALFLPWYGPGDVTGWGALTVIDVLIALIALPAVLVPITSLAAKGPSLPVAVAVLGSAFGGLAVALVLFRLIDAPADGLEPRYGLYVALAASIVAWVGSWLSLRDESTPGAAPPRVPVRPAPPS